MTIQIQQYNPHTQGYELSLMPVIRFPNFSDRTAEIPLERFFILVGNEKGKPLQRVNLKEYLSNFRNYLHNPRSWAGNRRSLLADRDSHVLVSAQACFLPIPPQGEAAGMNMVMLIQVPLKQAPRPRPPMPIFSVPESKLMEGMSTAARSNVEAAVISHGKVEGPFTEIDGLPIERDPRFPIRVTVQFYKATDNGVVSAADMRHINDQIAKVYRNADYVGSLVIDGDTGRPTEYMGSKQELSGLSTNLGSNPHVINEVTNLNPASWWEDFWQRHQQNTGQTREETLEMLRRLRGKDWMPRSQGELEEALKTLQNSP